MPSMIQKIGDIPGSVEQDTRSALYIPSGSLGHGVGFRPFCTTLPSKLRPTPAADDFW